MANILFVHGLGSSAWGGGTVNFLKERFPEDHVYSYDIPVNPMDAVNLIKKKVKKDKIDLIVSVSLGAFYAMNMEGVKRIMINPCVKPSEEIVKLSPMDEKRTFFYERKGGVTSYTIRLKTVDGYRKLEENLSEIMKKEEFKKETYYVFGLHDEHFSFLEEMKEIAEEDHILTCNSPHSLEKSDREGILYPLVCRILGK